MIRFPLLFVTALLLAACGPKGPAPSSDPVTDFIDTDGVHLQIVDGQYEWEAVEPTVTFILDIFGEVMRQEEELPPEVIAWVEKLPETMGMDEVVRRGSSTAEFSGGGYITKTALLRQPDADGSMWKLAGTTFDLREEINRLPGQTAVMMRFSMDAPWMINSSKETAVSLLPDAAGGLQQAEAQLAMMGIPKDAILEALKGGVTLAVCMNPDETWPVPVPGGMLLPQMGLVVMIDDADKTLHDTLLQLIQAQVPPSFQPIERTVQDVAVRRFLGLPLPVNLVPQIAHADGRLILATNDRWMEEILTRTSGEIESPLLAALQGIEDTRAQQAWVIGDSLTDLIQQVSRKALDAAKQDDETIPADMMSDYTKTFLESIPHVGLCLQDESLTTSIMLHQKPILPQGSTAGAQSVMTIPAVVGLGAAIALPAIQKARENAGQVSCINNLRQIQAAKDMWAIENNQPTGTIVDWTHIHLYIDRTLDCPPGGVYTLGTVGEEPSCSIHGSIGY